MAGATATAAAPATATRRTAPPTRSASQQMAALEKANVIRTERANMKRKLKHRRAAPDGYILNPPWWLESMKIFNFLVALPTIGRVKANRFLTRNEISPSRTVGKLTVRQRTEVLRFLVVRGLR